jgi:hypothetical protein
VPSTAQQSHAQRHGEGGLDGRDHAERHGVPAEEVELAHRHREQPLEGAGGALAKGGHAGHQEHHDEREHREQGRAEAVEQ